MKFSKALFILFLFTISVISKAKQSPPNFNDIALGIKLSKESIIEIALEKRTVDSNDSFCEMLKLITESSLQNFSSIIKAKKEANKYYTTFEPTIILLPEANCEVWLADSAEYSYECELKSGNLATLESKFKVLEQNIKGCLGGVIKLTPFDEDQADTEKLNFIHRSEYGLPQQDLDKTNSNQLDHQYKITLSIIKLKNEYVLSLMVY